MTDKTPNERWEQSIPHDRRSEDIYDFIKEIDEGYFDWFAGGDGDNGEELMYQLDCYFAQQDAKPEFKIGDKVSLKSTGELGRVAAILWENGDFDYRVAFHHQDDVYLLRYHAVSLERIMEF